MTFYRITQKDDGRILVTDSHPEGYVLAICQELPDGTFEPVPGLPTVLIRRTTRRWIAHALYKLQWDEADLRHTYAFLHDPRLMMPSFHARYSHALRLPDHVTREDGYFQLASVWGLDGPAFAPCISDIANQPDKWGGQIAALMEQLAIDLFSTPAEREACLDVMADAYRDALTVDKIDNPAFATRYDWANAEQGMEIIAVYVSSVKGTVPIRLTCDATVLSPAHWGLALASLTHEIVDTLAAERGEAHQKVFLPLDATYQARMAKAYARNEPGIVPPQLGGRCPAPANPKTSFQEHKHVLKGKMMAQIEWHNSGTALKPFHRSAADPIGYSRDRDQWFFYDETWNHAGGYHNTEEEARAALKHYCEEHL